MKHGTCISKFQITPEALPLVLHRFCNFDDGVVRNLNLIPGGIASTVRITIECMDRDVDVGPRDFAHGQRRGWSIVEGGIQIAWRGEKIYVVLDAYPDDPGDLPDLKTNTAYVVGLSCEFTVTPLPVR